MPIDAAGDFRDGLATTMWLRSIGFTNIRDVARIGVIETCALLRRAGHPVSLNLAYGLQADLMGTTWNRLPAEVKTAARAAYRERFG
jgi:DNA transformation protein and related proteins